MTDGDRQFVPDLIFLSISAQNCENMTMECRHGREMDDQLEFFIRHEWRLESIVDHRNAEREEKSTQTDDFRNVYLTDVNNEAHRLHQEFP